MSTDKITNKGPHKGVLLKVKVVRQGTANYAPAGFACAADIYSRMKSYFSELGQEEFWVLLCDVKNQVTGSTMISRGSLDASLVHPREVFRPAVAGTAANVVLVHNHPSGDPEPSSEDIEMTHRLCEAGRLLGIPVLDHIVLGRDNYVSLAERGEV
jgi:DNA repair protein RadC